MRPRSRSPSSITAASDGRRAPDPAAGGDLFLPYRNLAVSVLVLALRDSMNPAASFLDRESARRFLSGSRMLFHWCRVAALDPRTMIAGAKDLYTPKHPDAAAVLASWRGTTVKPPHSSG
jgi:hypothetical protein